MADGCGLMDPVTQGTLVKWQSSNISVHSNHLEGLLAQTAGLQPGDCNSLPWGGPEILHFQ